MSLVACLWILVFLSNGAESEQLKYLWGDAIENPEALSLDGSPYPRDLAAKISGRQFRNGRKLGTENLLSPEETRNILLEAFKFQQGYKELSPNVRPGWSSRGQGHRQGRADQQQGNGTTSAPENEEFEGCTPSRLCQSTYNTTAPLYGISLTSGKPVTIVQKFPDLLQQVVFQVCKSGECDVVHGECVQTFVPYLFLVLPLGPVSITGQDYILVESGCQCQPQYAKQHFSPPLPFIKPIN